MLQNVVLRLRKSLGAEIIETRPGGYAVRAIVDSIEFEHLVHDGRALAIDGDWHAASSALCAAVDLWRGPPLQELCEWPLGRHEAARLDELGRLIREEHAETELMCGRHHEVVPDLEAMVSDEPLRERRWALLMLALHRSGRQAEALRAFQRARCRIPGGRAGARSGHRRARQGDRIACPRAQGGRRVARRPPPVRTERRRLASRR